jgi:hypothetical protein
MSTLKDIIQRALGGEEIKVASPVETATDYFYPTETEKLAESLEYLALNLHAIDTPAEVKLSEFNEFLTKMAQDAAVEAMTQVPNDYHVDITGGESQAAPIAISNTVLPMNIPLVAPPGDMSVTALPTDDAALGQFHESLESPEMEMAEEEEEEAKVAGILRIYEMLKVASALDNPPTILAPRVDEPGLLFATPDGLGTPAGGPLMIPEIQSNESVIGSSARAITQAHNDEMLQYISENGEDPTVDALLDGAKVAALSEAYLLELANKVPKAKVLEYLHADKLISSPAARAAIGAGVGGAVGAVAGGEGNRLRGAAAGAALGGAAGYGSYHSRNAIYRPSDLMSIGEAREAQKALGLGAAKASLEDSIRSGYLSPQRVLASGALTGAGVLGAGYAGGQLAKKASWVDTINKYHPKATIIKNLRAEGLMASPAVRAAGGAIGGGAIGALAGDPDRKLEGAVGGATLGGLAGLGSYFSRNAIYRPSDLMAIGNARRANKLFGVDTSTEVLRRAMETGMLSPKRVLGSAALTGVGVGGAGVIGGRRATKPDVEEESKVAATLRILGVL